MWDFPQLNVELNVTSRLHIYTNEVVLLSEGSRAKRDTDEHAELYE